MYETIEVELCRDPILGLGITIAGYVHKKGFFFFFFKIFPQFY